MLKKAAGDRIFSLALLTPAVLLTVIFILVPVADSVVKSFLDYRVRNIISGVPGTWNNFANYLKLFQNEKLLPAIGITFGFVALAAGMQFILGMALALILHSKVRGSKFLQSIMMTPWVVPTIISALIWMWIFQPQYGLLKYFADVAILNRPHLALFGIAIAALWKQIPLSGLLLLASLQNVPTNMVEAAKIDGANGPARFFRIMLPAMKSTIAVIFSMAVIENFKQFPLVWTMTGGGPNNATTTLAILSYREAFVSNNLGSGAAVTTIWMLLMILVLLLYNRLMRTDGPD
ncbi:sugar ABC transporter permease [Spirochaetia bacterium]|nr:sugar ABC transporter permease [Spirochaetia bacterium]